MQKIDALIKKRNKLKQEITNGMNHLLMGLVFEYTSRAIRILTRGKKTLFISL